MTRNSKVLFAAYSGMLSIFLVCSAASAAACDRGCLVSVLDSYLQAVIKHDPGLAPLAPRYRATENTWDVKPGEGVWKLVTGYGDIQRRFIDTETGQAAYLGLLQQEQRTVLASLRIKVHEGKVTEAEWTLPAANDLDGIRRIPPPEDIVLPKERRRPRSELIAIADSYFRAVQDHDGSRVPHVPGCDRIENGRRFTNLPVPPTPAGQPPPPPAFGQGVYGDCVGDFQIFEHTIAATVHRRYLLVDEQQGVVLAQALFHRPPELNFPRNLVTEYFLIDGGKVSGIWVTGYMLPADESDRNGWTVGAGAPAKHR